MNAPSFESAEKLVMAAMECLRTARSLIEDNIDNAHPSLLAVGGAFDAAEHASDVLGGYRREARRANVVPIAPVIAPVASEEPMPEIEPYWRSLAGIESCAYFNPESYFSYRAKYGSSPLNVDTKYALETLACESMLAAS